MLMALLPLAGWAQTPVNLAGYSIKFGDSDQEYAYYSENTQHQAQDNRPAIKLTHASLATLEEADGKFNVVWKKGTETVSDLTTVGVYTVTVTANNSDTYGELETSSRSFWVLQTANGYSTAGAVVAGPKAYQAAGWDLLGTTPVPNFGTVKYIVKLNDETVPGVDDAAWSTTAPHATKVGAHSVFIKVDGTENYKANNPTLLGTVTINGTALVENTDYRAPVALGADITFDNANHALVATAGAALKPTCTMWYKLGADGEWQTTVPEAKNVAAYTVYWKAEGADGYADATGNVAANIVKGTPIVTASAGVANLEYNGGNQNLLTGPATATIGATPVYTIKYSANEPADAAAWAAIAATSTNVAYSAVKGKKAGYYQIQANVVEAANYNAAAAATATVVQIKKKSVTVTADAKTKVYGTAADPALTATYAGFAGTETATNIPTADFTAAIWTRTAGENVDEYPITKTADAVATNYTFTYDEDNYGKFTITPKELNNTDFTFTLADATKVYTGSALSTTVATAKFGTVDMTAPADYTYVASNNTNVGTANVIISGQGNFKGSIVKTFAITPKPVYIKPTPAQKNYGDDDPEFTYSLVSAPAGAVVEDAVLNGTVTLLRTEGENVGTYKIYVKSYEAQDGENYKIADDQIVNTPASADAKNITATFTINATGDGLVLKFKNDLAKAKKTKVYGNANPAWTIDDLEYVSGKVGTDDWETTIKPALSAPVFGLSSEDVNDNNKVQLKSGLVSANYPNVTVQEMDFEVTARPITVTLTNQTIDFGGNLGQTNGTHWNITTGSLATGDVVNDLNLVVKTVNTQSTYAVSATPYAKAITAEIDNDNYELSVVEGDLTVQAGASITLNRDDDMDVLIKAYGGQNINVKLNRNITRTEAWFAMVLPFETNMTELVNKFGYCVVNVLDESNADPSKVKFKLAFGTIAANQPFLVKLGNKITAVVDFGNKDIVYDAAPLSEDAAHNKFHGVFKETTLEANPNYWTMIPSLDKFQKLDQAGTTLTPINAYLETAQELNAFAPAIFVEDMDGSVTAINVVNADALQKNAEGWYTINGMKLNAAPTEKGVYINNGKKVIIK